MDQQTVDNEKASYRVGRVIKIEDAAKADMVEDAVDGAFLTPDRIADMAARFQQALEKQRVEQAERVWKVIRNLYPETLQGDWSFNPYTKTVVEMIPVAEDDPANPGQQNQPQG